VSDTQNRALSIKISGLKALKINGGDYLREARPVNKVPRE